ncbi:pollen-specific leucine-rich repeat extensin-like protein 4 [Iris pallida]|uniref:Pollen-specific leucine-rich repeat extensin-like protein 4 n=1 Tax=Iris pallida TaxID=29817 RepID=A0AAX6FZL8_IRIPA|nr:pollen-specific leucine-rich repeat extensin-like protein 4 [Iris pallida]
MPPPQIWEAAASGMLVSRGSGTEPQPRSRAPPLRQAVPEIAAGARTERSGHARASGTLTSGGRTVTRLSAAITLPRARVR